MTLAGFQPQFIFDDELTQFGLPTKEQQPDIVNLVQLASTLIDEHCGRIDGDGNGSLVYTTYFQRLLLPTRNRNLLTLPMKPIVGVTEQTVQELQELATASANPYYTGVLPNTINGPTGALSGLLSASGRYGYTRQDMSVAYPDLFALINPLNLVTMFGGPAPFVSIDVSATDYDPKTGECWMPAGLQLQRYSEVIVTYNSGYDPRRVPRLLKFATASVTKNAMAKGDATTAMMTMNLGRSGANISFHQMLIDPQLDQMLTSLKVVRAY